MQLFFADEAAQTFVERRCEAFTHVVTNHLGLVPEVQVSTTTAGKFRIDAPDRFMHLNRDLSLAGEVTKRSAAAAPLRNASISA